MIAWLISRAISSGLAGKVLAGLLVRIGMRSALAEALAPVAIRSLIALKEAAEKAEKEGKTDEEVIVAVEATLPPYSPSAKVTAEQILRGEPYNV